jgi:quinoprotein dehydrogenase-associated SoxYZ-like carrier
LIQGILWGLLWALFGASLAGVQAQTLGGDHAEDSPIWHKVRASLFQERPIHTEDNDVIALEAPARAEDAATVPIAMRARIAQRAERSIARVYLVIDNNPSPISATFHFTALSGRADIETRVRIEQYTWVRAIAETSDGQLYMATRYVKASGGCSAPAGKDVQAAQSNLGRMKLRVEGRTSQPVQAQLMISHPNSSGLVMDQLSRLYVPAHFVHALQVTLDGAPVLSAELDISISENPNFRFFVMANPGGTLRAEVQDTQDRNFTASTFVPGSLGSAAPPLAVQQVAPGVYLLAGAAGPADGSNLGRIGNIGFVVGTAGVVVINTGTSHAHGLALLQAIQRVTDQPVRLALVTHSRAEFLFGATAFQAQGIPVHMHHQAAELMRARCQSCLKNLQTWLGVAAMQGTHIFQPELEFAQSHRVQHAGRGMQVLYFGHASGPGDVAVLDEQSGVLFAGGLLDNQRIPEVQDSELAGWRQALQSLRHLPIVHIVPGHGPLGAPHLIDDTERYLTQLEDRVYALQQQGTGLQTIATAATLPEFSAWDGYETTHRSNAAKVFLRQESALLLKP